MDVIFFFNTSRSYWVVSCRAGLVWSGLAWPGLVCAALARLGSVFCRLCSRLLYVVAKPQVSVDTPCHYTIVLFGIASRYIAIHTHTPHTLSSATASARCAPVWSSLVWKNWFSASFSKISESLFSALSFDVSPF